MKVRVVESVFVVVDINGLVQHWMTAWSVAHLVVNIEYPTWQLPGTKGIT
jgi:hypothetical protein